MIGHVAWSLLGKIENATLAVIIWGGLIMWASEIPEKIAFEVAKKYEGPFGKWDEFKGAFDDYFITDEFKRLFGGFETIESENNLKAAAMANYDFTWETADFMKNVPNSALRCFSVGPDPDSLPIILEMHYRFIEKRGGTGIHTYLNSSVCKVHKEIIEKSLKVRSEDSSKDGGNEFVDSEQLVNKLIKIRKHSQQDEEPSQQNEEYLRKKYAQGNRSGFYFKYDKKDRALEVDTLFSFKGVWTKSMQTLHSLNIICSEEEMKPLLRFARLSHSIGNFGLIPYRAGRGKPVGSDTPKRKISYAEGAENNPTKFVSGFTCKELCDFNFYSDDFRNLGFPDSEISWFEWKIWLESLCEVILARGKEIVKEVSE